MGYAKHIRLSTVTLAHAVGMLAEAHEGSARIMGSSLERSADQFSRNMGSSLERSADQLGSSLERSADNFSRNMGSSLERSTKIASCVLAVVFLGVRYFKM